LGFFEFSSSLLLEYGRKSSTTFIIASHYSICSHDKVWLSLKIFTEGNTLATRTKMINRDILPDRVIFTLLITIMTSEVKYVPIGLILHSAHLRHLKQRCFSSIYCFHKIHYNRPLTNLRPNLHPSKVFQKSDW